MLVATTKHLRKSKRGVSNVIVVMLSLVLVVIIVSNVVLWSYQMNQIDWERMQEKLNLVNVERTTNSPWFTSREEYAINAGSHIFGTYVDTQNVDSDYESFSEGSNDSQQLNINGDFALDLTTYPTEYIGSLEIQLRYRVNDSFENWFLRAYNWTEGEYGAVGFNFTLGDTPTSEFRYYGVNVINDWESYVQNGTIKVMLCDEHADANQTSLDIDFLGVRFVINKARFSFTNEGSMMSHVVSIWITNSTVHTRFDADFFVDSEPNPVYIELAIDLPAGSFTVRAVTERGNIAVFNKS